MRLEPRFGVFLFTSRFDGMTDAQVLDGALAVAEAAERAGFEDLWVSEHHFISYGINPSGVAMAAFLLGRTRRLRIGTAVTILPTLPPVLVAEQAALLDQLSGGRFDLGVGRAGPVVDYEALGASLEHWERGLPEAIELLLAAWSGSVAADSDLYRFRRVRPVPRPRTLPHPPLLIASTSPASVALAARHGLPMLLFFHQDDVTKAALVAQHAELARAAGHPADGYGHACALVAEVAESDAAAMAAIRGPTREFLEKASSEYVLLRDSPARHPDGFLDRFTDHILSTHPVGAPATVIERLTASLDAGGCRRVLLKVENTADTAHAVRNVRRLGAEVLPAVRRRLTEAGSQPRCASS